MLTATTTPASARRSRLAVVRGTAVCAAATVFARPAGERLLSRACLPAHPCLRRVGPSEDGVLDRALHCPALPRSDGGGADDEDIKCVEDSTRTSNGRKVRSGELHPRPPRAASPLRSAATSFFRENRCGGVGCDRPRGAAAEGLAPRCMKHDARARLTDWPPTAAAAAAHALRRRQWMSWWTRGALASTRVESNVPQMPRGGGASATAREATVARAGDSERVSRTAQQRALRGTATYSEP